MVSLAHDTGDCNIFFRLWMQLCWGPPSSEGGHWRVYGYQAASLLQDTVCVRPADLINNYDIRRGCLGMCYPGTVDYHEDSLSGNIICAEGG